MEQQVYNKSEKLAFQARAIGFKLGQNLSNHLSNPKGLNQSPQLAGVIR